MYRCVLVLVVAVAIAAESLAAERCSALPTPAERIVCYDRQYPPDHPAEAASPASTPSAPASGTRIAEPKSPVGELSPQTPAAESSTASRAPAGASEEPKSWIRGMFDKPEQVTLTSTIKALRRRETQNTIFILDNEQLWLQDSGRQLPFRVGDSVTIKNGTFGGYFMTSQSGTKTRVRRIK